jgi:hypothetical protein
MTWRAILRILIILKELVELKQRLVMSQVFKLEVPMAMTQDLSHPIVILKKQPLPQATLDLKLSK